MRTLPPINPPRTLDPKVWQELRKLSYNDRELQAAIKAIAAGTTPDQRRGRLGTGGGITGLPDHGTLPGIKAAKSDSGTTTDFNDDHDMYAHLPGRLTGQTLFGSRSDDRNQWVYKDTFTFAKDKVSGSTWSSVAIQKGASVGDVIVLTLSSDSLSASGETTDHSTVADSQSNTWVKQKEQTEQFSAGFGTTTSIWTCIVTTAISATSDTLTVTFSGAVAAKTIQAVQFSVPSGITITLSGSKLDGTASGSNAPSQTISGLTSDEYLFVRADGIERTHQEAWQAGANFTKFEQLAQSVLDSTTTGGAIRTNNSVKGEYRILTGTSSVLQPIFNITGVPIISSVFVALKLAGVTGSLTLSSVDTADAATVNLEDDVIHNRAGGSATDRHTIIEDPAGTELSYFRASDGGFVGPVTLAPKVKLLNTDLFDDVLASTAARGGLIVGNSTPAWSQLAIGAADFVLFSDGTDVSWVDLDLTYLRLDAANDPVTASLEINPGNLTLPVGRVDTGLPGSGSGARMTTAGALESHIGGVANITTVVTGDVTALEGRIGTESNHPLQIRTNNTDRITITAAGLISLFPGMATNIDMNANDIIDVGFLGINATVATASGEDLRITTAAGAYGWKHDDGTRELASFVDASGGWLGTVSAHDLIFFTGDGTLRGRFLSTGEFRVDTGLTFLDTTIPVAGIANGDLLDKSAAEAITGLHNFSGGGGLGGLTDYDITVGDVTTPDYGLMLIGDSLVGRTSFVSGALDLDGAFIIRNMGGAVTGQIEFVFTESTGPDVIRFAIPKSGVGNATYNSRSMLLAGPAVNDNDVVTVGYWQTNNSIFDNLACDTSANGADLGVQNDLEVEGDIFTDSIKESTSAAGITVGHQINFTQTDGNENIDSQADGFLDYTATTAHRFRDDTGGTVTLQFPGTSNTGQIRWFESLDRFIIDDFTQITRLGVGAAPSSTVLSLATGTFTGAGSQIGIQSQVIGRGSTEAAAFLTASDCLAHITTASVNEGRNFETYRGGLFRSIYNTTHNTTWATRSPTFQGGVFSAAYSGTGIMVATAGTIKFQGGFFQAVISANPTGAVTIDEFTAGEFELRTDVAAANITITDAMTLKIDTDVSDLAAVTRLYGIRIGAFVGSGTTEWGINCLEDVQIGSDKYLILEGDGTTKGDTRIRWNSGASDMEFDINATTKMTLDSDGLDVDGGLSLPTVAKTGAYTATGSDYTILCDATSAAFTITLPAVASHPGRVYNIKKIDGTGNAITVDGNASETIDDATTATISTQYESIMIQSDGSEWWIL